MKPIVSFFHSLRDFWANDQQRKTLMWVIAAVGAVVLVYGVVQIVQGQIDYQHRVDASTPIESAPSLSRIAPNFFVTIPMAVSQSTSTQSPRP